MTRSKSSEGRKKDAHNTTGAGAEYTQRAVEGAETVGGRVRDRRWG